MMAMKRKFGRTKPQGRGKTNKRRDEDDITSEESEEEIDKVYQRKNADDSSSESDYETADQKRKRLAQEHLQQLKAYIASDDEEGEIVARQLHQESLEKRGRHHREIAAKLIEPSSEHITTCRGHQLTLTCLVITPDNKHIFTGSKDSSIIKWNVDTGKKVHTMFGSHVKSDGIGHSSHILCLGVTSDGQYLASGGRDRVIKIWNAHTCVLIHATTTHQHRDTVTGLVFRNGSHELFSCSSDRTVKVWNVTDAGIVYVETLFGHEDMVASIDALHMERAITCGAADHSIRVWKIVEESQLVFHGHSGSIDCVCFINGNHFFSGASDGSLSLWSLLKKKPIITCPNAHSNSQTAASADNWITAVAALPNSDLVVSGSKDGFVRFWKCGAEFKSLTHLFSLPVVGFVNGLKFSADGQLLAIAVGREHKLGRWWNLKEAKNSLVIVKLIQSKPA